MVKVSTRNDWETYWSGKDRVGEVYSNKERIARHLKTAGLKPGAAVLEVGAGTGRDSAPLAGAGSSVYQLDYSFESLRLIRQTSGNSGIYPVGGNAFSLPFRDDTFDAVLHQGLLEHFRKNDVDLILNEQIRVLKHGGLLLIDVPQRYHPYTVLKHLLIVIGKWFAGWERSFSYRELNRLVTRLGLQPVHRYGEWMNPSLLYRVGREFGKKIGIVLPLYPPTIPVAGKLRQSIRDMLLKTPLPLYTGVVVGIVFKKQRVR